LADELGLAPGQVVRVAEQVEHFVGAGPRMVIAIWPLPCPSRNAASNIAQTPPVVRIRACALARRR
jgi:hypothetical protein